VSRARVAAPMTGSGRPSGPGTSSPLLLRVLVRLEYLGRDAAAVRDLHTVRAGPFADGLGLPGIGRGLAGTFTLRDPAAGPARVRSPPPDDVAQFPGIACREIYLVGDTVQ